MNEVIPTNEEIEKLYQKLNRDAEAGGYHLNPDVEFTKGLVFGLIVNDQRYGYQSCPCRLASGSKQEDLDIICPCDYRDPDLTDYETCYCGLYVSNAVKSGERNISSIPERRPPPEQRNNQSSQAAGVADKKLTYPVWRCKVCGYLCARESPPEVCPVCKAKKDRFEQFM